MPYLRYLLQTFVATMCLRWPLWATLTAAVPPLVTLPKEIWLKLRGLLAAAPAQCQA
jgi:hypothetical protein